MTRATVVTSPLIADINNASHNNFESVPALNSKKGRGWAMRLVNHYDIETVLYMVEPWERMLVRALLVLFVASLLHFFTYGSAINVSSFFEKKE